MNRDIIEQKRVIEFDDGNILVTASAGSGKTHVMIERAIRLIAQKKATVKEILAVTFTDAAACEMKERLKMALMEKVNGGADYLASQINDVALADISTLHSFCSKLLRQNFFALGIAPDFKVMDENDARVLRNESIEKTFSELYEKGEEWFITLTNRYKSKRKDETLKKIILDLQEFVCAEAYPDVVIDAYIETYNQENYDNLKRTYKEYLDKEIERCYKVAINLYERSKDSQFTGAEERINDAITILREIKNNDLYKLKEYGELSLSQATGKPKDEIQKEIKEDYKAFSLKMESVVKGFAKYIHTPEIDKEMMSSQKSHTEKLVKLLRVYLDNYKKLKEEENSLDFDDLQTLALKGLNDSQVANSIREKYKYIFVDEYQDINALQEELISKITNDNVFMVGDAKQSIYGFRGCLADAFNNKMRDMLKNNERVEKLNDNFRSAKRVRDMVNTVFNYSMTQEFAGLDYYTEGQLKSGEVYMQDGEESETALGRAQLHLLVEEKEEKEEKTKTKVYDILNQLDKQVNEENNLSALIAKIIRDELGKKYFDPKKKVYKNVTFSDIAILAKQGDTPYIKSVVNGLTKRSIPIASKVTRNLLEIPEVAVLLNCIKLVDNFEQDIPLYVVLKSVVGGFSEEQLYEIVNYYYENVKQKTYSKKTKTHFYQAILYAKDNLQGQLGDKLKTFYEYFCQLRFLSDYLGVAGTLEKIMQDSMYQNYLLADKFGERKLSTINSFINLSKGQGKQFTIREFIAYAEANHDAFEIGDISEEDNVSVMTIHKSKGLQFPVVILFGLEKTPNVKDESETVLQDREIGLATKHYGDEDKVVSETILRGIVKRRIAEKRERETQRLLYVAMTRAAYSLHMIQCGKKDMRQQEFVFADKFIDFVPKILPVEEHFASDLEEYSEKKQVRKVLVGISDEKIEEKIRKNLNYTYPHLEDTQLPLKVSVTGLSTQQDEQAKVIVFDEDSIELKDKTSILAGTIAHRILEHYDFARKDLPKQVEEMLSAQIITNEELSLVNVDRLETALSNDIFKPDGKKFYKEKSFIVNVQANKILDTESSESVLLQGVVDLLVDEGDGFSVVDYKYSRLSKESLREKYKPQVDLYAYAVERAQNARVKNKTIVNIFSGEIINLE